MALLRPFWLVWSNDGYPPKFQHDSPDGAEREAQRLAREKPGQYFYVLEPISRSVKSDVETVRFTGDPDDQVPF